SHGLAHLLDRQQVTGQRLAVGKLIGAKGAFGVEIVEQACGTLAVGVFADVTGLPGLVDVAAEVELDDLIVGLQIGVSLQDVGRNLLGGFAGLFARLDNRVLRALDFTLVPVKDRQ